MRVHLLGTAAAKPVPRPFCRCRGCRVARDRGGQSLRTRTSVSLYLGDDGPATVRYKVDLGPDVADHAIRFGESLTNLEHLLVTHAHQDHIFPYWLGVRRSAISGRESLVPLHLWGNQRVMSHLKTDLGLDFEAMRYKACGNHCQFCFIDQNPPGMRKSIYFKDEDYRLSFLCGNYVTLTRVKQDELDRIVQQRLSPIYISVHATDTEARKSLLGLKNDETRGE